jgi:hypothetical protein
MNHIQWLRRGMLTHYGSLRDDDLAYLMGTNTKELHRLCGTLEQQRLLARYVDLALSEAMKADSLIKTHSIRDERRSAAPNQPDVLLYRLPRHD